MQYDRLDSQEPLLMRHMVRPAPTNPPFLTQRTSARSIAPRAGFALRFRVVGLQDPKHRTPVEKCRPGVSAVGLGIFLTIWGGKSHPTSQGPSVLPVSLPYPAFPCPTETRHVHTRHAPLAACPTTHTPPGPWPTPPPVLTDSGTQAHSIGRSLSQPP